MTRRGDHGQSKLSVILIIAAVSSIAPAVTGLGVFQIKILSVDVTSLPSICSSGAGSPCKDNDTFCGNNTILVKACLSHHQLPLPYTLQCTFGKEEVTIPYVADGNSKGSLWKPDAVMIIPFTFSWPGGFSLSVSASWGCHVQESTEASQKSNSVVADHLSPSLHWTTFKNNYSSKVKTHSTKEETLSSKEETHSSKEGTLTASYLSPSSNPAIASSDKSFRIRAPKHGGRPKTSLGSLSKIYIVNSSETAHMNDSSLQKSSSYVSSKETDSDVNIHTTDNSQTTYTGIQIFAEISEVSRTNIKLRSRYAMDAVSPDSGDDSDKDNAAQVVSTSSVVRHRGKSMFIAVRILCQEHYFDNSCSKLCRPRDDFLGHYSCSDEGDHVCLQGWAGDYCTEAVCSDRCIPTHGTCTSPYTCTCRHGWYGEHCERCRTSSGCKHGICRLPGQCLCHQGWTGPLCDVEELFCLENRPCQNGGVCLHDDSHNYTCSCPAGYTGTHCEVPLCHKNFCLHGGVCKVCAEVTVKSNSCNESPTTGGQVAEGTRYCLCSLPFSGPRCQHRLTSLDIKSPSTSCNSTDCSYRNFPEETSQSQNPCQDSSCFTEFLNQASCQGHVCYNKGTCILHPDYQIPECVCPVPFSGLQCLQVMDPCQSNPCNNGTVCKPTDPLIGSFMCVCASGYFGDLCSSKIAASSPGNTICDENVICQHGGLCQKWQRSGQYFCKCSSEFTGEFCEIDKNNQCSSYVCLNRGSCVLGPHNDPECVCQEGYTGRFCQNLPGNVCSRVICQNGGTCLEHDGEFVCSCRKNFEGIFCEKSLRSKQRVVNVHIETLTTRNEKLEIKIETTVKSTGAIISCSFLRVMFSMLGTFIAYIVLV